MSRGIATQPAAYAGALIVRQPGGGGKSAIGVSWIESQITPLIENIRNSARTEEMP
jgi:hypothetical protein